MLCASCIPSGAPPTADVFGSQNGLFMTDDGRAFFSTDDGLVPRDTNKVRDTYEFVAGPPAADLDRHRPGDDEVQRLQRAAHGSGTGRRQPDGTDVYFATFDVLVTQDHNGQEIKIYDARTDGGFPSDFPAPGLRRGGRVPRGRRQPARAGSDGFRSRPRQWRQTRRRRKKKSKKAKSKHAGQAAREARAGTREGERGEPAMARRTRLDLRPWRFCARCRRLRRLRRRARRCRRSTNSKRPRAAPRRGPPRHSTSPSTVDTRLSPETGDPCQCNRCATRRSACPRV